MFLLGRPLEEATTEDIQRLVDSNILEDRTREYKQTLKIETGDNKKELLADISAMANADGGVIVFGIKEVKQDAKIEIEGISSENTDLLIQKLEDIIRNGIEPKAIIKTRVLTIQSKLVLLLGVRKNWGIPQMVTYNGTNKFYKRRNSGKYLLDVYELNEAFMAASDLITKADDFRRQRILKLEPGSALIPEFDDPAYYLHIVPLNNHGENIDFTDEAQNNLILTNIRVPLVRGFSHRFNLEGLLCYKEGNKKSVSSTQIFRNGAIEFYTSQLFETTKNIFPSEIYIYGHEFEKSTISNIRSAFKVLKRLKVSTPVAVFVTLVNIERAKIKSDHYWSEDTIGRKSMYLSSTVFYDFEENISFKMKSVFDTFWQAANNLKSPNYNHLNDWLFENKMID